MALQRGQDLIVRVRRNTTQQSYVTVAGLRQRRLKLSAGGVRSTHTQSPDGWRELLAGAGMKSVEISGNGVFADAESDALLSAAFFDVATPDFELVVPGFAILRGAFLISELAYSGHFADEAGFSIILKSAGAVQMEAIHGDE